MENRNEFIERVLVGDATELASGVEQLNQLPVLLGDIARMSSIIRPSWPAVR